MRFNPDNPVHARVVDMRQKGYSPKRIDEILTLSKNRASGILYAARRAGLSGCGQSTGRLTAEEAGAIRALARDGLAGKTIAVAVGRSPATVSKYLASRVFERQVSAPIDPPGPVASPPPAPPQKAVAPSMRHSSAEALIRRGVRLTAVAALHRLPYAEVSALADRLRGQGAAHV